MLWASFMTRRSAISRGLIPTAHDDERGKSSERCRIFFLCFGSTVLLYKYVVYSVQLASPCTCHAVV